MSRDRFNEAVAVAATPDAVFAVIVDPLTAPRWSRFILEVEHLDEDTYLGETLLGPIEYEWHVHPDRREVVMAFEYLGYDARLYYRVEETNGQVYYREQFPLNPNAPPDEFERALQLAREELDNVRQLAEATSG